MEVNSDRIISEGTVYSAEISELLTSHLSRAHRLILSSNLEEGLSLLKTSEELLESVATRGGTIPHFFILSTLHNTALCYQKLNLYDECASYLDGCEFNAKSRFVFTETKKNSHSARVRRYKYLSRANLQLCAVLSVLDNHKLALTKAKTAVKFSELLIKHLHNSGNEYIKHYSRTKGKVPTEISRKIHILEFLVDRISNRARPGQVPKLGLHASVGVPAPYTIGEIMEIEPLLLSEFTILRPFSHEFSADVFHKNISSLIASYFCVATELKFLCSGQEARWWHEKALSLAQSLLPKDSAFLQHIAQSLPKKQFRKKSPLNTSKLRANSVRGTRRPAKKNKENLEPPGVLAIQGSTSAPKFLEKASLEASSSESSVDSEYVRGLLISSDELYGDSPRM